MKLLKALKQKKKDDRINTPMETSLSIVEHAQIMRENMSLSEDDVVPDIVELIKFQKYEYVEECCNEDYAGFSEYIGNWKYRIGFNKFHDYNPQFKRFTLAHEIGHVFLPSHQMLLQNHRLHRSYQADKYEKYIEREADAFAANFLAPSKACQKIIQHKNSSPETIKHIAKHFNISTHSAALRFIDLTDIVCTIVVFNETGETDSEHRSPNLEVMLERFFIRYVCKTKLHEHTLAAEYLKGKRDEESCESSLNLWYPELPKEVPITESILDLGYNGKFMALLTPTIPYLDEYLSEEDRENF